MFKNIYKGPLCDYGSSISRSIVQDYLEDVILAVGIVEDLNLNTRIWIKDSMKRPDALDKDSFFYAGTVESIGPGF